MTWTVDDDGPADFHAIQEAINNATSGDTIFVHKGTYKEDIVVNKSLLIIGEDRDLTIIGGHRAEHVISIKADSVTVRDFTVNKSSVIPYSTGILLVSRGTIIDHNKITNIYYGLVISSSNNVISDNVISNTSYGISIFSGNNVFSSNVISNNYEGVDVYFSSNNVFSSNVISNNSNGVGITLSSNNIFYHNDFYDAVQVSSESVNVWTYSGEGNYWINHTGRDLNFDGIGEEPYLIDANNQDQHPLMGMFSDFNVVSKSAKHYINVICNSTISDFKFEIGEETGNEIIRFNVTGEDGTVGFCRIMIPTNLMNSPFTVLDNDGEIIPTLLSVSNATNAYLYFTYNQSSKTITIISSKMLQLYSEIIDRYLKLQKDLYDVNATYYGLLSNYTAILSNHGLLQQGYLALNSSHYEHLLAFSENTQNVQKLTQIFAATTAIFLITTIYLSKYAHASAKTKTKASEEEK